jgi:hypothetical protein
MPNLRFRKTPVPNHGNPDRAYPWIGGIVQAMTVIVGVLGLADSVASFPLLD